MKINKRYKIVVSIILILVICLTPILVIALEEGNLKLLGTNEALGSPLLNPNFKIEAWNKWELVTFGVFLSNFVQPLVDDYKSAFTVSDRGSKGAGLKALQFGSASDASNNTVLKEMLNYVISNQQSSLKPLKVRFRNKVYAVRDFGYSEYKDATINDFMLSGLYEPNTWMSIMLNIAGLVGQANNFKKSIIYGEIAKVDDLMSVKGPILAVLPEFSVPLNNGIQNKVVFDYSDGWDIQMITAWLSKVCLGDYKNDVKNNLKILLDSKAPIYLDSFGNIVSVYNGKCYMIFPSAANQHITSNQQYNLLQSVLFNNSYLDVSNEAIINGAKSEGDYGGCSAFGGSKLTDGKTVILFDTDTLVMKGLMDLHNSGKLDVDFDVKDSVGLYSKMTDRTAKTTTEKLNYSKILDTLFRADIRDGQMTMPFRVEMIKAEKLSSIPSEFTFIASFCESISNMAPVKTNVPVLDYIKGKTKERLFIEPVVTSVITENRLIKKYINYLYESLYSENPIRLSWENALTQLEYRSRLLESKNLDDIARWAFACNKTDSLYKEDWASKDELSALMKEFIVKNSKRLKSGGNSKLEKVPLLKVENHYEFKDKSYRDLCSNITDGFRRLIKVYPFSPVMRRVSNVLCIKDGTDFAVYSPYIYATYLEWYGILGGNHKFDTALFNENSDLLNFDIKNAAKEQFLSVEERKESILKNTYLMLHPTEGRAFRSQMIMDGINEFIYKTYQNIVYGRASEYYSNTFSNLATRVSYGFLNVNSYRDNFLTSWFVERYVDYVIYIIAICSICIIIIGLINRKSWIWFLASFTLMINIILLTPMLGEITPYVANNAVDNMFNDKMSYWAMSEGVSNAKIEKDIVTSNDAIVNSINKDEKSGEDISKKVLDWVRKLNIVYLDRQLSIKTDISKKVIEKVMENSDEIQRMQSARWLLPIFLRQFTAGDMSANYVYQPLGDIYNNLSVMYWYYVPSDRVNTYSLNSTDSQNKTEDYKNCFTTSYKQSNLYLGYKETSVQNSMDNGKYNKIILNSNGTDRYRQAPGWQSISRLKSDKNVVHTSFYLLDGITIPAFGVYSDDTWKNYVNNNVNRSDIKESFMSKADVLETYIDNYDPLHSDTVMQDFGYLWTTENLMHYFYQVVKDTMKSDVNIGVIAGELQGVYKKSDLLGEEVRHSFMHYQDTGKIRDFLDMEELFTNLIPYMYQVQIIAGGFDGKSGVFGDAKIEGIELYKNNKKSWLFRSNWVTKLMESSRLNRPDIAIDVDGKKHNILNPMLPSCYPDERPMVFSEAQMYALGLNKSCLTNAELKILKVNEAVEKKWTLLLNYVNVGGLTKEVLFRQMATDALLEFNREFSPSRGINPSLAMYPTGLDLRSISFDSIMKMLMLNTTKDARYIYGDTMKRVIENSDIISALLMLLSAFLCSYIIPFLRDVVMGVIFYLGFISILLNIVSSKKTKLKISAAYIINNGLFLIMTVVYLKVFAVMINMTYSDNVLNVKNVVVNTGSPVGVFLIIIILSVLYIWGSWKLLNNCLKNYRDLGFEVYATLSQVVVSGIIQKLQGVGENMRNSLFGSNQGSSVYNVEGSGNKINGGPINDDEVEDAGSKKKKSRKNNSKNYESGHITGYVEDEVDDELVGKIDKEIEKGKKAGK